MWVVHVLLLASLATVALGGVMSAESNRRRMPSKEKMMRHVKTEISKPENRKGACISCTFVVDGLQQLIKSNRTDEEIAGFLTIFCDDLNLQQPHVCYRMYQENMDMLRFVLERTLFTPAEICGAFIPDCGVSENPLNFMWNITIPDGKPLVKPWPTIPSGKPTFKVLHLSDIHVDRQYEVGSEAYCELDNIWGTYSLCCRADEDEPTGRKPKPIYVPSGKWGMPYNCDIPYRTFDAALKHISTTHTDLDYVMLTGDFEAHDPWDYTQDLTTSNVENITATLLQYFPKTPIYIAIGNHEGVPEDAMAPHTMDEYDQRGPQWIYTIMKNMWAHWIPSSALPDVQYRASYVVYPKPGLKLISLNTIYCAEYNYYLYINQVDPDATLEWLIEQLADSEGKGELVHIISHIPPGDNYCLKGWSHNFFKIVHRYENTIAEQFYGHTHYDHFQVYYESSNPNTRPFHYNWISPSISTFYWINPAYRIFTIDGGYQGATYRVKDADTYWTDLEAANSGNTDPVWKLEYSYKSFYNMTDFSPQSWADLTDRLWTDKDLFRKFIKLYYRNAYNNECWQDTTCHKGFICSLKSARSYDDSFCTGLV